MYEGDFMFGSADYEVSVTVKNYDEDNYFIHSCVKELVIDKGYGNDIRIDLLLAGFSNLEKLIIKQNSLKNVKSLKLSDNPVLTTLDINDSCFCKAESVTIESMMIDD